MPKLRRIDCRGVHNHKKFSLVIRRDHKDKDLWFIGMPGAAALLSEEELMQMANSIADLLEEASHE